MDLDFGEVGTAHAATGRNHAVIRKIGRTALGAAIAGLIAFSAPPALAGAKAAPAKTTEIAETAELPSLGRHVRRAARLPFNVALKFDDQETATDAAAKKAKRPSLARFVRARGHGSEATTMDGYGPDRLVESVTFPSDAPLSNPRGTAMADVKNEAAPGL